MIDHRQEGSRKDSDRSERTRFGGFFVARAMRIKRRSVIFKRLWMAGRQRQASSSRPRILISRSAPSNGLSTSSMRSSTKPSRLDALSA